MIDITKILGGKQKHVLLNRL